MVADLMPASSPWVSSRYSILKPCFSAQRVYMRSSIEAQSWLSVPPPPAWTSRQESHRCASVDFKIGVEPVGLARQQRFGLAAVGFLFQVFQCGFGFRAHAFVVLGL